MGTLVLGDPSYNFLTWLYEQAHNAGIFRVLSLKGLGRVLICKVWEECGGIKEVSLAGVGPGDLSQFEERAARLKLQNKERGNSESVILPQ